MTVLNKMFGADDHAPRSVWTKVDELGVAVHTRGWFGGNVADGRPPFVLVHGLALSSRYMIPLGRRLAAMGYDVLAPDLPGFGRTPRPARARWPAAPNVREQADQLLMWMDACGIRRAVLFGDSVGSQVVVDLAARFPDRVDRLVLKGPTPDPRNRNPVKQYARVLANMPFEAPSLNPLYQVELASAGLPRMVRQLRRTVDDPIETKLPDVRAPALVLRGRYDRTLSQSWAEEFTRLLPNGRLVIIDGAAHNVHYTAAAVTARLIGDFLDGRLDGAADGRSAGAGGDGGDEVVPRLAARNDPLAPPKPLSTRAHGVLDWIAGALYFSLPRLVRSGPRTRRLMTSVGNAGHVLSLCTDYESGVVRKVPMAVHLNFDMFTGLELLTASATLLRGEPLPGRCAVAAMGVFELVTVAATRLPTGPARLVPLGRPVRADALNRDAAAATPGPAVEAVSVGS